MTTKHIPRVLSTVIVSLMLSTSSIACPQIDAPDATGGSDNPADIEQYWTKERMESAVPAPMGRLGIEPPDQPIDQKTMPTPAPVNEPEVKEKK